MHVRKATLDDAQRVLDIRREAIRARCRDHYPWRDLEIWTSGDLSETFAKRVAGHFHAAIVDGQVVGTGMVDLTDGRIDAVFVLPEYMGQGIGRAMMHHLEGLARHAGLREVRLDATLNAVPFYRANGFEGEGTAVYHSSLGVSLTCVPMTKQLRSA